MINKLLDQLGDWNPQFLRELRGNLQQRNILVAITISLFGQFLLFILFQTKLPVHDIGFNIYTNKYCTGNLSYGVPECLTDNFGNIITNWQLWWLDLFTWLSIIGCFILLVTGTYLLINNLATEERRDTLNFIRLSPQSPQKILLGKILGVPILLYLTVALAIPLHLGAGLAANISLIEILYFDVIVVSACFLYYSAALLFGLVGYWLGGFQVWLGSGTVLGFLIFTQGVLGNIPHNYSLVILNFLNPSYLIPHLSEFSSFHSSNSWFGFHWFALPLGANWAILFSFVIINYGIITYFFWQSLQRCFRNPNSTMLRKQQSYLLTSYFVIFNLGCASWQSVIFDRLTSNLFKENIACLLFLYFGLFAYLVAAITPHRQNLQDWARYHKFSHRQSLWDKHVIKDLIWGEKSPALLAIAFNALIAISSLIFFILVAREDLYDQINAVYSLVLAGSLAMIYAALAQLTLFMKTQHRVFWTTGIVGAVIVLPLVFLVIFSNLYGNNTFMWLFSILGPLFILFQSHTESLLPLTVGSAIAVQAIILGFLVLQLQRRLQKAGESATKALLSQ